MKLDRRRALLGMTSALLLPRAAAADLRDQPFANEVFAHGIASGDPGPDSVVLWTRISAAEREVEVGWSLAADPGMQNILARGSVMTSATRDHTVKVLARGLPPGRVLYYRFETAGAESPTGRTRTLPTGRLDQLVVAVASCSNYPFGQFNGYQAIADDPDVDVVVHLGDYLYEYDENGYGGDDGRRLGRIHWPRHETVTLGDYRLRHAQYKSDPGSLAMHAMHPLIPTWDDHESTNNPWTGGAQNHQAGEGDWLDRRSVSLRAYYEWMPVREPGIGQPPEERRLHFAFGDLASLYAVESRHSARSEPVDFGAHRETLTSPAAAADFYANVVGEKRRRIISTADERFLARGLADAVEAGRPWRILANQTILANVVSPRLDDAEFASATQGIDESSRGLLDGLTRLGELRLPSNMDAWDGYPAARERLYRLAADAGVRDLLVVTGDTHVFWQNRLVDGSGRPAGLELGTSAITSPRGFTQLGARGTTRYDQLLAAQNDSVDWVDGRHRGFIRLTLHREGARAEYVALSTIDTRNFDTRIVRSVDISRRSGTLDYS